MEDVLHPIFDLAFDQLGERVNAAGETLEAVAFDEAGLETIRAALAEASDDAAIALGALAAVLDGDGHTGAAAALHDLLADRPEAARAVRRGSADHRADGAREAHDTLFGRPRPTPRAAEGGLRVGLGLRFRLQDTKELSR